MSQVAGFLLALAFIAAVAGIWASRNLRRSRALERVARNLGFEFSETATIPGGAAEVALFRAGESRNCSNLMRRAEAGGELLVFDYSYHSGRRDDPEGYVCEQTVAALRIDGAQFPPFELAPRTLFHQIASLGGAAAIRFEDQPEFTERFLLLSEDEGKTRAFFDRPLLDFLARWENPSGLVMQGGGSWLVMYKQDRILRPDGIAGLAEALRQMGSRFRTA